MQLRLPKAEARLAWSSSNFKMQRKRGYELSAIILVRVRSRADRAPLITKVTADKYS
jgi:hypothetical protein